MKNYRNNKRNKQKFRPVFNVSSPPIFAHFVKPLTCSVQTYGKCKNYLMNVLTNLNPPLKTNSPAISVIIPLYNAEKYLSECLNSILAQTFQDFEVILVDDCSTDSSCEIVENYIPKFDGRLKLYHTEKNSGSGAIARNVGLSHASGEYIYNMDNDDMLTKTALEEMYTLAKEYDADVVYCEKYYMSEGVGEDFLKNIRPATDKIQQPPFVNKPTFEPQDLSERIQKILNRRFWVAPWLKLIRHDLINEHKISFPNLKISDDDIWTYALIFSARKFLRVPNMVYIRRMREDSLSLIERTPQQMIHFWLNPVLLGLKELDSLLDKHEFFKTNIQQRYDILKSFVSLKLDMGFKEAIQLSPVDVYDTIKEEFGKNLGEYDVLISAICAHIFEQDKILEENSPKIERKFFEDSSTKIKPAITQEAPKQMVEREDTIVKDQPLNRISPAISIIVSLYNYENYIGECLDSLLAQTFQDFEVIVVDDCSTDNSVSVVESYAPKFNGRLKLTRTEKNTGGGGEPRNIGFRLSIGEYVFFMDADDAFTKTALEEMYTLAKEYDAEVVYCEKYYMSEGSGENFISNIKPANKRKQAPPFVDKPTFETDDMVERTKKAVNSNHWVTPWLRLVQRDFLIDNNIMFDSLIASNDVSWSFKVFFCAKRFLRVPNICYIRRMHDESTSFRKRTPAEYIHKWMDLPVRGLRKMDYFLDGIDFFRNNLNCRYSVLNHFLQSGLVNVFKECQNLAEYDIYSAYKEKFGNILGEYDVLISALCAHTFKKSKTLASIKLNAEFVTQEYEKGIIGFGNKTNYLNSTSFNLIPKNFIPRFIIPNQLSTSISVVIPMYNAERYVAECLESLLIQTFQDFEIIIVDDCSTDDSIKIIESYAPKFNGRLKLAQTEKNSGTGGYVPRNIGFNFASGEYIFFMDADDFVLGSALEILYNAAKENDADIVYMAPHYEVTGPNRIRPVSDGRGKELMKKGLEDKVTLTVDDPEANLNLLLLEKGFTTPWSHFVRRKFLIENKLFFPEIPKAGDYIWVINSYCHAKRFLRITTPLYFYRRYDTSSVSKSTAPEHFF